MMQTLLTPITPPASADKSALAVQAAPSQGEDKAEFADLMSQYRQGEQTVHSKETRAEGAAKVDGADKALQPDSESAEADIAVSLARQETDAKPGKTLAQTQDAEQVKGEVIEDGTQALNSLAGHPFLAHLQDSFKQDTRLVSPPGSQRPTDGNMLPPASGLAEAGAAATSATAITSGKPGELVAPQGPDQPALADEVQAESGERNGKLVTAMLETGVDSGSKTLPGALPNTLPAEALTGGDAVRSDAESAKQVTESGRKPDVSTPAQAFAAGTQFAQQGGPLPASAQSHGPQQQERDRALSPANTEGEVSQDAAAKTAGDKQAATPVTAAGQHGAPQTGSSVTPTLVASSQVLAQAQSQGNQAPVTSLPQGISAAAIDAAAASAKKEPIIKGKLASLERSESFVTSGQKVEGDAVPPSQHQGPHAVAEPRVSQTALNQPRADAPSLPHLKLASQDAPTELQQRVNVMLADKLQQAEIQLDPLGLGKMKIQIQLGQDSQASVNFVVQHGQTREMLEQAMPRLREMLAGQGIQLGQTSVQQQTQQQTQQQSQQQAQGFSGQGHGQSGREGGHSARHEAESGVTRLTLSMDAANESGIDFYA